MVATAAVSAVLVAALDTQIVEIPLAVGTSENKMIQAAQQD
jgi:hypothetical protein